MLLKKMASQEHSMNKVFNKQRMEKALNSKVHTVPEGLSREELRQFILSKASAETIQ